MSTNQERSGDWVRESTPHDGDWAQEDEYGIALEEWDDYSSEQADPTPTPPAPPSVPVDEEEPEAREAEEQPPAAEEAPAEVAVTEEEPAFDETAVEEVVTDEPTAEFVQDEFVQDEPADDESPAAEEPPAVDEFASGEEEATRDEVQGIFGEGVSAEETEPVAIPSGLFGRPADAPVEEAPAAEFNFEETALLAAPIADPPTAELPGAEVPADGVGPEPLPDAIPEPTAALDGLYREGEEQSTAVIDADLQRRLDEERLQEERNAMELQALREERNARLGVVPTSEENASRAVAPKQKLVTDKFLGSLGLFVLRLIVAGILGIVGYQILTDVDTTSEFLATTQLPEPRLMTWILGFTLGAIAVLLVIGLLVRVAGLLLLVISVGSLAFVRWGSFSIFVPGMEGFLGDRDLLMAGVALLLLCLGGGRWGVDGAFRKARDDAREARLA